MRFQSLLTCSREIKKRKEEPSCHIVSCSFMDRMNRKIEKLIEEANK